MLELKCPRYVKVKVKVEVEVEVEVNSLCAAIAGAALEARFAAQAKSINHAAGTIATVYGSRLTVYACPFTPDSLRLTERSPKLEVSNSLLCKCFLHGKRINKSRIKPLTSTTAILSNAVIFVALITETIAGENPGQIHH